MTDKTDIHSPFNACMYQEHCKRMDAEIDSLRAELARKSDAIQRLWRERDEARAEADECHDVRERMSALLTATANALKGPPPPLTLHDWSDLPGLAEALKKDAERYRWLREQNDWYCEPRIDEGDGTRWELMCYSPQRIEDPTDDDNLDAAIDAAIDAAMGGQKEAGK